MTKAVQQYLTRYAEPEVAMLNHCLADERLGAAGFPFQFGMVLPCYNESPAFLSRFIEHFNHLKVCLVLVINQPDYDDNTEQQQTLLNWVSQHCEFMMQHQQLMLFGSKQLRLLVVKRFEGVWRIPAKQGVGLARKIGADLLAALYARGLINCSAFGSSDADAWLPSDYFSALETFSCQKQAVAGVFDFTHGLFEPNHHADTAAVLQATLRATRLYEQWLHYYVAGLRFASSPYSYHTIGSCLAFESEAYCQVRGFPKRAGGEDFYLLNKLAKIGAITALPTQIKLQARVSNRVPFGTGPAVQHLLQERSTADTYSVYHPRVFELLADVVNAFDSLWQHGDDTDSWLHQLPVETQAALSELGWQDNIAKIRPQCRSAEQLIKQANSWFDGFRTLRFIHLLERSYFFPVSLREARQLASFDF